MKIATWNLERALPQSVQAMRQLRWLDHIAADIWILTETHLGVAPGGAYRSAASNLPDRPGVDGERWVQIWAKGDQLIPLATTDEARTAAALLTTAQGQQWVVYGTVLPWVDSSWRSHPPAQGSAFAAALEAQKTDWQRLQLAYPEATLVVAGDFNQDLNALHYYGSRRNKQVLRQTLDSVALVCLTAGEHDPVHRLIGGQHSNINHICVARACGSFEHSAFAWPPRLEDLRGLSDHLGVGVEVNFDAG